MICIIVLGLLAFSGTGECAITGWTTPLGTGADFDGGIEYRHEGTTGTIFTYLALTGATSISTYLIDDQTVSDFFEIATSTALLTLKGTNVLDGAATTLTHVVKVKATDDIAGVGTATVTIKILPARFSFGFACVYILPAATTGGAVITNPLSSATGTDTLAFASGNTNTDFLVSAAGAVTTAKAITTSSGPYTLVITGVDAIGTTSTVTSTVSVCVRDTTCSCSLSAGSGATHITAGLLGMFATVIMMLLK